MLEKSAPLTYFDTTLLAGLVSLSLVDVVRRNFTHAYGQRPEDSLCFPVLIVCLYLTAVTCFKNHG